MSFTDTFIKRPVFACVLSLVIFLFGLIAYSKLPLRQYPKIDATVISISTSFPGASATLMENQVTTPIETAISGIEGLDYIRSQSTTGSSNITVHFKLGYKMSAAVADVTSKVSSARFQLPKEVNDPIIQKEDPNSQPILFIAYSNPNMNVMQLNDYLVRAVQPVLQTLPGVGQARIFGKFDYAMRLWLNPFLMSAHGITLDDVAQAMKSNNLQTPTGRIKNSMQEFNITVKSDISTPQQFNNLVIKQKDGSLLRMRDIGKAELGTPETRVKGLINGNRVNMMGIIPRSDANPLTVAAEVKANLLFLKKQFPKGMEARVVWDNANFISHSIREVKKTIIEAVIFVLIIIFLFLGSLRTILIPIVTIPLSLIGVSSLMLAMGYSLNTITFLAIVLAIGMVVDDAIVVSENIHRHIELGKSRFQAAITGAREIRFAVIAMTLTLAAVYIPIIFTSGLTGALFKEFAFTLACAVIISGFVALTLSPMMCSKFLAQKGKDSRLEHWINHLTDILALSYKKALYVVIRFRPIVLILIAIILAGCYFLYSTTPKELAPKEDSGGIFTVISGPASANINYTQKYVNQLSKIYSKVPEGHLRLFILGWPNVNSARSFMPLTDWSHRDRSVDQIIASLYPKLRAVTGVRVFPMNPPSLPGSGGSQPISFIIKTTGSYQQLNTVSQTIKREMTKSGVFKNVGVDLNINKPQFDIKINRNLAALLGVNMETIGTTLNYALGAPEFNRFTMKGRSYYVLPQLENKYRNTPSAINNLNVRTSTGELVPLSSFVTIKQEVVPQSLNHFQQMRAVKITANPAPGYSLGKSLSILEKIAKKNLPPDMQYDFAGSSRRFMEEGSTMIMTFGFALLFIFLVLSAQFESFIDPLIVMFAVPLSSAGALLFLKLSGGTINIYTQIGLITLVGLISKHGILMVEFANQLQERGESLRDAIINAASIRLRPILMTTAAMILGATPLALASGAGSNSRHQIGVVIIGGMAIGTLFTLFVVPVIYTYLAAKKVSVPTPEKEDEVLNLESLHK